MSKLKRWLKEISHKLGIDVRGQHNNPSHTLLGLRNSDFKTVLDIGANIGQSAKSYRVIFPNAKIHCFEPLRAECKTLKQWAATQSNRVIVHNVALGNSVGTVQINLHEGATASSSLLPSTELGTTLFPGSSEQSLIDVPLITLDACLKDEKLSGSMLVKMDVQGFELRVIEGGENTIKQADACIVEVSIFQLYEDQATFYDIAQAMHRLGFHYAGNVEQSHDATGKAIFLDALFLRKK